MIVKVMRLEESTKSDADREENPGAHPPPDIRSRRRHQQRQVRNSCQGGRGKPGVLKANAKRLSRRRE